MSLNYSNTLEYTLIGSKSSAFALTASTLTTSYADNRKVIDGTSGMSKLDIRFSYTTGAAETNNTLDILVEQSSDGTNWFSIPNETVSSGTSTLNDRTFSYATNTGGGTNTKSSVGLDIFYKQIRVSFKETGVAANHGTVYAECSLMGE